MAVAEGAGPVYEMMWQARESPTELTGAQLSRKGLLNDGKPKGLSWQL